MKVPETTPLPEPPPRSFRIECSGEEFATMKAMLSFVEYSLRLDLGSTTKAKIRKVADGMASHRAPQDVYNEVWQDLKAAYNRSIK